MRSSSPTVERASLLRRAPSHDRFSRRVPRLRFVALAALMLALPACKEASEGPGEPMSMRVQETSEAYDAAAAVKADGSPAAEPGAMAGLTDASFRTSGGPGDSTARSATAPMLLRTGTMRVRVRELAPARRAAVVAAERRGGYVGNESETNASYGSSATLTLRVPAAQYAALVDTLAALGTVEERSSEVEDVTRAFADLDARTKTRLATEQRFRELLARAQNVEEVMAVERQLSEIRGEIEGAQAQLRSMRDRAALSTLTVTLSTSEAQAGPTFFSRFGDALRDGGALLLGLVLGLVRLWGLWVLLALAWFVWRRWVGPRWHARRAARDAARAAAASPVYSTPPPPMPSEDDGLDVRRFDGGSDGSVICPLPPFYVGVRSASRPLPTGYPPEPRACAAKGRCPERRAPSPGARRPELTVGSLAERSAQLKEVAHRTPDSLPPIAWHAGTKI